MAKKKDLFYGFDQPNFSNLKDFFFFSLIYRFFPKFSENLTEIFCK